MPAQVFQIETAFCFFKRQSFYVTFKQVVDDVHIIDHRTEMLYVDVVKIHLLHQCVNLLVLIPEMQIIDNDLFKDDGPGLARFFFGGGVRGGIKIIENKGKIAFAILLLFQVNRGVIKLYQAKVQFAFLNAAKRGENRFIPTSSCGAFNRVSLFLSSTYRLSRTTDENGLIYIPPI